MEAPLALAAVISPNSAVLLFINSSSDLSHTQSLQTPGRHQKDVLQLETWGKKGKKKTYLFSNHAPSCRSFLTITLFYVVMTYLGFVCFSDWLTPPWPWMCMYLLAHFLLLLNGGKTYVLHKISIYVLIASKIVFTLDPRTLQ